MKKGCGFMEESIYLFDDIHHKAQTQRGSIYQYITGRTLTDIYHSHDFYEFIYMLTGGCTQCVNEADLLQGTRSLLILRPGDRHSFLSQTDDVISVSLSIRKEEFEQFCNVFDAEITKKIQDAAAPIFIANAGVLPISRLDSPSMLSGETAYDHRFLLACFLKAYADSCRIGPATPDVLARAVHEMQHIDNLRRGIDSFLELTHYSRTHLARLVRQYYGMSLKQFVNDLRLKQAYHELALTEKSVEDIAESLGFFSFSHFSRIFKARFGITPAALRRQDDTRTV